MGKTLNFEVAAYIRQDAPACHAARGDKPGTSVMFGPAGFSYVYLIYGIYHCLNIVTEREGFPAAVLIRGLEVCRPAPLSLSVRGNYARHCI